MYNTAPKINVYLCYPALALSVKHGKYVAEKLRIEVLGHRCPLHLLLSFLNIVILLHKLPLQQRLRLDVSIRPESDISLPPLHSPSLLLTLHCRVLLLYFNTFSQ